MFGALRKLRGSRQDDKTTVFPAGVVPIAEVMQKKFAKGVQYNMKIVLKGDRNTGKSALLNRLQGGDFLEGYIPSPEIKVADINWHYKGPDDVVKVEVWDIVDKSSQRKKSGNSLKIANEDNQEIADESEGYALDAEFLDVYKGTHGVIFLLDITKQWTWQYVQREIEKVPFNIPVLVMANYCDMWERRVVDIYEITAFLEHMDRPSGSAELYFTESSMKEGFGLKFVYKFLNMPFLILQRETLLQQLKCNALEIEEIREEIFINLESENQNYDVHRKLLEIEKLVSVAESVAASSTTEHMDNVVDVTEISPHKEPPHSYTTGLSTGTPVNFKESNRSDTRPVATVPPTQHQPPVAVPTTLSLHTSPDANPDNQLESPASEDGYHDMDMELSTEPAAKLDPVNDFNPIEDLDDEFLTGNGENTRTRLKSTSTIKSSESEDGNPMVADFADLDSDTEDACYDHQAARQISFEYDDDEAGDDEADGEFAGDEAGFESEGNDDSSTLSDKAGCSGELEACNGDTVTLSDDRTANEASTARQSLHPLTMDSRSNTVPLLHSEPSSDVVVRTVSDDDVVVRTVSEDDDNYVPHNTDSKNIASEDDDDDEVIAVAGDIDFDSDVEGSSFAVEVDGNVDEYVPFSSDDEDAQESVSPLPLISEAALSPQLQTEPVRSKQMETESVRSKQMETESVRSKQVEAAELNFAIDDLEMFMTQQLTVTPPASAPVVVDPVTARGFEGLDSEQGKPRKASKSKKAKKSASELDPSGEEKGVKKKKKKKKSIDANPDRTELTEENTSSVKSKKKTAVSAEKSAAEKTKKPSAAEKTKKPSAAEKTKKPKLKKQPSVEPANELDAFYADF